MRRTAWILGVLALAGGVALAQETPKETTITEEVEVRLLQVDVKVDPPPSDEDFVIPLLTLDHFKIRVDNERLGGQQLERTRLDRFCQAREPEPAATEAEAAPPVRPDHPVIIIVDFNYLDAASRNRISETIATLADDPARFGEMYKVYGYGRRVELMTEGFTRNPEVLRTVADKLRAVSWRSVDTSDPFAEFDAPSVFEEVFPEAEFPGDDTPDGLTPGASVEFEDTITDALKSHDPRSSCGAIEGILRANRHITGRKTVVLFSSSAFSISRFDVMTREVNQLVELARQSRFQFFTVDASALDIEESGSNDMLAALGMDTGGGVVRRTNNLDVTFEKAREQLSCYYLISVPVSKSKSRSKSYKIDVTLNTDKYPDLWKANVLAPTRVTLLGDEERVENDQLAALVSPEDFSDFPIQAGLGFAAVGEGSKRRVPIRMRIPLRELSFLPEAGGYEAKLVIAAVVERLGEVTPRPVCNIANEFSKPFPIRVSELPAEDTRDGLIIELDCEIDKDAGYRARVSVVDLNSGRVGAATSQLLVWSKPREDWEAHDLHLEAASPSDLYWKNGLVATGFQDENLPWVRVPPADEVDASYPMAARYVLCGPDAAAAPSTVAHFLLSIDEQGRPIGGGRIDSTMAFLSMPDADGAFCATVSVALPSLAKTPGEFLFVTARTDQPLKVGMTTEWWQSRGQSGASDGILGILPVRARKASPDSPKEAEAAGDAAS
ncbi:MAG: hypothetical protein JSV80_05545, partial [Acidobacteriota bacterium]